MYEMKAKNNFGFMVELFGGNKQYRIEDYLRNETPEYVKFYKEKRNPKIIAKPQNKKPQMYYKMYYWKERN